MEEAEQPILRQEYQDRDTSPKIASHFEENGVIEEPFTKESDQIIYPYTVEYENETIYIDFKDWRKSNILKLQVISAYLVFIVTGMAEQAVGTLIPELQKYYNIGDIQTSSLYFASVLGYFIMALANNFTHHKFGVKGVTILGATSMTFCYLVISLRPPFYIFVMVYIFNGIGLGSLDAGFNTWMGNLVDSNQLLGILHGCYGVGCMISPTLITTLLEKKSNPWKWNYYYILLAVVSSSCLILLAITFRYETPKKMQYTLALGKNNIELSNLDVNNEDEFADYSDTDIEVGSITLANALKSKLVWAFSLILFTYVGAEVAFGQWIVSFLMRINKFQYNTSSYMASCFWTGLMVGRVGLGFLTALYFSTELLANLSYISLSLVSYILFWFFSFTSSKVLLYVILFTAGLFTGPIFPTTIVSSIKILPVTFHAAGVGFICAFGGGGAAALPLVVGILAESSDLGLKSLPLIVVVLYVMLTTAWLLIIKRFKNTYRK